MPILYGFAARGSDAPAVSQRIQRAFAGPYRAELLISPDRP
jgi:hypothetical protein